MAHQKVTRAHSANTGVANTYTYSGSFDTFKATEVVVTLDNVDLTYTASTINESASPREYTVDYANKTIHIGGANLSSGTIVIKPVTDVSGTDAPFARATYSPGSSVTSEDLNNNQTQLLRKAIEYEEQVMFKSGGTFTGSIEMGSNTDISFEGATDDAYETTLTVTDPTADRTITLPNVTGTVVTTGDTATVTATMMASNSVASDELTTDAVTTAKIANNAVTSAKIADGTIVSGDLASDSIDSQHYVDGSIDSAHIGAAQVTTAKIADDAVTNAKIAANAVESAQIANNSVIGNKIPTDAIGASHIAANAVGSSELADDAVDTAAIADDAVTNAKIAANAVESAQIANNAVIGNKIPTDAIGTSHIAANAVTTAKINADAITGAKIADDAIDSEHYAAASIDNEHLADDAVGADELAANAVVNASVASGAAIAHSKLAAVADTQILVGNGSNVPTAVAMSGDATIANTGAVTIAANAVEIGMIGCEQTTISDSDSHIPTSGAVVDYVTSRLDPIGGLEVIADDESFEEVGDMPPAGVVVSITDAAGLQVNSSGVSTNGDTKTTNAEVTINGFPNDLRGGVGSNADPYVFQDGAGLMVVSTGSSNTYNYHQALIRESDFVQLSDDINDFNNRYRVAAGASGVRTGQCGADGTGSGSYPCDGDMAWFTGSNAMYVFDAPAASTGNSDLDAAWKEVTSTGDFKLLTIKDHDQAVGGSGPTFNGSNEEFDLFDGSSDASITNVGQLIVSLNGVIQKPNTGTFSGSEEGFYLNDTHGIKFCDPPPSGSVLFVTQIGTAVSIPTPGDGTVSAAKIAAGAVTTAKIGADAVDATKIADDAVGAEHIEDLDANVKWVDSAKAVFGTGNDMEIYHNGTDAIIDAEASGATRSLILKGGTTTDRLIELQSSDAEPHVRCAANSYVKLYHDNSQKLETTAAGVTISGTLTADLADDSIDSEHYVDGSIDHAHLADDCVDGDNIADNSVGLAAMAHGTDGNLITFDANGAPAYVATGNDGQVLTSTGAGSPPAFETISTTDTKSFRNLVINGAMQVAQRGTSSTSNGYHTVDRFQVNNGGDDEAPTQAQVALAINNAATDAGFRYALKVTNGNQTSGAGATDYQRIRYKFESQDLAWSGWNYKSASSYITMSFWCKSSVSQNFYVQLKTSDADYNYVFETGSLSANTWTKVTHSIPGNANLVFDNDTGEGMYIAWHLFRGTDNTGSMSLNTWAAENASLLTPDQTSTWWTTNDATFELTGVQIEVGSTATDFEHRPYSYELRRCRRYYEKADHKFVGFGNAPGNNEWLYKNFKWDEPKRTTPTVTIPEGGTVTGSTNSYTIHHNSSVEGFHIQLQCTGNNNDIYTSNSIFVGECEL